MICLGNGIGVSGMIGLAQRLPYARTRQPPAGDEARPAALPPARTRPCRHATGISASSLTGRPACSSLSPTHSIKKKDTHRVSVLFWSGRRGSNSLPRPWQGRALPDELRPQNGASGRSRTNDTRIFSPLLYQLSYRGIWRPRWGSNPRPPA